MDNMENKEIIINLLENKKNIVKLLETEYINSLWFKNVNLDSKNAKKDFIKWVFLRQKIGTEYAYFLKSLGLSIRTAKTAEIGKSIFDTIVSSFDTTVITPYDYSESKERILKYDFFPSKTPGLIKYNENGKIDVIPVPNNIKQFITQNPYNELELIGYEDLFNANYNVIVGVYGHIHDNDKENKLKMLKNLKEKIKNDKYKIQYESNRDSYFATIYSSRQKIK